MDARSLRPLQALPFLLHAGGGEATQHALQESHLSRMSFTLEAALLIMAEAFWWLLP